MARMKQAVQETLASFHLLRYCVSSKTNKRQTNKKTPSELSTQKWHLDVLIRIFITCKRTVDQRFINHLYSYLVCDLPFYRIGSSPH